MSQPQPFETILDEAKALLNQLMDPAITLEESLRLYEEGRNKIKMAQQMIEEAKAKIQTIEQDQSPTIEPSP